MCRSIPYMAEPFYKLQLPQAAFGLKKQTWARLGSNQRPSGYEPRALPLSYGPEIGLTKLYHDLAHLLVFTCQVLVATPGDGLDALGTNFLAQASN